MKIMLYCQHVLGIGHLFRSMEIARALHRHRVLFVEGGEPLPGLHSPEHVNRAFLEPLRMVPDFHYLETSHGDLEFVQSERRKQLLNMFNAR